MFPLLAFFWFLRTTKFVLFYLYLWQLKEYHLGRFIDHFRTEKGKRVLFNDLIFLKIILLFLVLAYLYFLPFSAILYFLYVLLPSILLFVYVGESIKARRDLWQRKIKFPQFTKKAAFLLFLSLSLELFILLIFLFLILLSQKTDLSFFAFWLLLIDLFIPALISALVLALQPLAVFFRNQIVQRAKEKRNASKDLLVIGITGSYGKSSTKEFLHAILAEKLGAAKVLKTKANQNSEVGISQCILQDLTPEHEIFIAEMGAYGRGGIKLLCEMVKPKIGILTGINEQHLALFASQENIIKTKYELIESLPDHGLAIFNGDDARCLELYYNTKKPKRLYLSVKKEKGEVDLWAQNIIVRKDFVFFKACDRSGCTNFKAYIAGAHFVPNLLAAILVAKVFGMSLPEIAQACLQIKPIRQTMKIEKGKHELVIIDDSYSSNPAGVIAALDYLQIFPTQKLIILPNLIELGKASKSIHRKIGEKIGKVCDAAIVTTKERFEDIKEGALKGGMLPASILFSDDPKQISEIIDEFLNPGDVVLLEGRVPNQLLSLLAD